jgi:hypothetical protein
MPKALKHEVQTWMLRLFVCGACNFVLLTPYMMLMPRHKNFVLDVPHILLETGIASVALVFVVPVLTKATIWFRLLALLLMVFPILMLWVAFHFLSFMF